MSTINTILIKRRLESSSNNFIPQLSGGELAFSEKNHTLYYGGQYGTLTIAGSGAFVSLDGTQTIPGYKTFSGITTLSSTTFSNNSVLDFGGNVLTNIGEPLSLSDAATRNYVDNEISTLAGSGGTAVASLSAEVANNFVKLTDDRAVNLTGGLTVNEATVGGNLTVTGDLNVLGAFTNIETDVTTTSAFQITNHGSDTALKVTQVDGNNDVAEFIDGTDTALIIKGSGNVGVGTNDPNQKLTVSGNISASGTIFGAGSLEILGGGGSTTLYVENGKVGINTETPNEELTVVGSISATENIYAANANFIGTVDIDGAVHLKSTLTVDGSTTLNDTLDVIGASTFTSTISAKDFVVFDSTLSVGGLTTLNDNLTVVGQTSLDNGSITTTGTGTINGTPGVSELLYFTIDGGSF
jgi:hypothetical protein